MGDFSVAGLIFSIIGGLGLFIFGIRMMSDGLKKVAGDRMREILGHLTNNRFRGLLLGVVITSVVQSSSATTVMVVGFVNAGLMTLVQVIPIILGANIGTTITAQLIAFKLTNYALPIIGIGAALHLFSRKKSTRQLGEAILGFGILFLGLSIMSSGVKPLGNSQIIRDAFTGFSGNIFLGIAVGTIATMMVQSSSVTTGIVLTLAGIGLLDLTGALFLVIGTNIGTCITALLASIGTSITAKRAAISHVLFNVIGTIITIAAYPLYKLLVISSSHDLMRQIANFHTIFNVTNAMLFVGFVPLFAKFIEKIVPGKEKIVISGPRFLDKNLLNTPSIAINAVQKEIARALIICKNMLEKAMNIFSSGSREEMQSIINMETRVDELKRASNTYLSNITEKELTHEQASNIPALLHSINDVERIADHALNIAEISERKLAKKIFFNAWAKRDILNLYSMVDEMISLTIKALPKLDKKTANEILENEKRVNKVFREYRNGHTKRLGKKEYELRAGILFSDMLINFERIADHLTNIAQAIKGDLSWDVDHYEIED
ncbi:MAG: Na/Pi cotransporter family protein [Nanoarchaeota archaeon]